MVELMTVLGILSILLALTIPAVQAAREAARAASCANDQRQLGIAVQQHVTKHRYFPGNGGDDGQSTIRSSSGRRVAVTTRERRPEILFRWGVGRPGAHPRDQTGCWAYAILPDLEQLAAYRQVAVENAGPIFSCPSRGRQPPMPPAADDHAEYSGGNRSWAKTDYAANIRIAANHPAIVPPSAVGDGLSHTILLGEKAYDPTVHVPTSWYWDEPVFTGGSRGTARDGNLLLRDGPGIRYKNNWSSAHAGYVQFTMLDGATRRVSRSVDWKLLSAAFSIDGDEISTITSL